MAVERGAETLEYVRVEYAAFTLSVGGLLLLSLKGTPSTTHSGWLLSVNDELPRRVILVEPLKPVPAVFICRPATLPLKAPMTEGSPVVFSLSALMSCTA